MELKEILFIENKLLNGGLSEIDLVYDEMEFLQTLNKFVQENIGIFQISNECMYNYKKIIAKYDNERYKYIKEILKAYTFIMNYEELTNNQKEQCKNEFINKIRLEHNIEKEININELIKIINIDNTVYRNLNHFILYYKKDEEEYIKYSMNYFINKDKENIETYQTYINLYRENGLLYEHKNNIIEFPKKKSFLKRLFRK